jgi:hypothetical protein
MNVDDRTIMHLPLDRPYANKHLLKLAKKYKKAYQEYDDAQWAGHPLFLNWPEKARLKRELDKRRKAYQEDDFVDRLLYEPRNSTRTSVGPRFVDPAFRAEFLADLSKKRNKMDKLAVRGAERMSRRKERDAIRDVVNANTGMDNRDVTQKALVTDIASYLQPELGYAPRKKNFSVGALADEKFLMMFDDPLSDQASDLLTLATNIVREKFM